MALHCGGEGGLSWVGVPERVPVQGPELKASQEAEYIGDQGFHSCGICRFIIPGESVYGDSASGPACHIHHLMYAPFCNWNWIRLGEGNEHIDNAMHPACRCSVSGQTPCLAVQNRVPVAMVMACSYSFLFEIRSATNQPSGLTPELSAKRIASSAPSRSAPTTTKSTQRVSSRRMVK